MFAVSWDDPRALRSYFDLAPDAEIPSWVSDLVGRARAEEKALGRPGTAARYIAEQVYLRNTPPAVSNAELMAAIRLLQRQVADIATMVSDGQRADPLLMERMSRMTAAQRKTG